MRFKSLKLIALISFSAIVPFLSTVAITPGTIPSAGDLGIEKSPVRDVPGLVGVLKGIVQVTYTVFFIIAVLLILFAAYNYLTAQGAPEKINTAHKQLLYAGIAIVIALLAVGTSAIIRNFLENPSVGGGGGGSGGGTISGIQGAPSDYTRSNLDAYGNPQIPNSPRQSQPAPQPIKGTEGPDIR